MTTENPCIPGKLHTATAAEAIVEADPAYREFLQRLSCATCETILARTDAVAARLEAQLTLALVLDQDEL